MTRNLIIKPPFKLLRLTVGAAFIATGSLLVLTQTDAFPGSLIQLAMAGMILLIGICLAFLERVVVVDRIKPEIRVEWSLSGLILHRIIHDISRADRILIMARQEPVVEDSGIVFVADRSYPVIVCAGDEPLVVVTGRDICRSQDRRKWDISLPSPAFFPSFSRYAAAQLAKVLELPLDYRPEGMLYLPDLIPDEWLNQKNVRADLSWCRYNHR